MRKYRTKTYNNFSGGYTCEIAQFETDEQNLIKGSKNIDIVTLQENGYGIQKTLGNTELFNLCDSIVNLFTYQAIDDEYLLIHSGSSIYEYNEETGISTAIKTGLTESEKSSFCNMSLENVGQNSKCIGFFTNGVDAPFTYEKGGNPQIQTVDTTARDGNVIKSYMCLTFDNRIHLFEDNKHYWSKYNDPYNFTEDSSGAINAGYEPLDGFIESAWIYSDGIVIATTNGLKFAKSNGSGGYTYTPLAGNTVSGYRANAPYNTASLFHSEDGIYPVEVVQEGVRKLSNSISFNIDQDLHNLDLSNADKVQMLNVAVYGRVETWINVPLSNYPDNSVIFIARWKLGNLKKSYWLPPRIQQKVNCIHTFKNMILSGTPDGKVLREMYGRTFDGSAIEARADFAKIIIGSSSGKQSFKPVMFLSDQKDNNFKYSYVLNGDSTNPIIYSINRDNSGSLLWGESNWGENWATSALNRVDLSKAKSNGKKTECSLEMSIICDEADHDFKMNRLELTKVKAKVK